MKEESFEGWMERYESVRHRVIGAIEKGTAENAWTYQQEKINELVTNLKSENKSHNYHRKESQRKNDVIYDLKKELAQVKKENEGLKQGLLECDQAHGEEKEIAVHGIVMSTLRECEAKIKEGL